MVARGEEMMKNEEIFVYEEFSSTDGVSRLECQLRLRLSSRCQKRLHPPSVPNQNPHPCLSSLGSVGISAAMSRGRERDMPVPRRPPPILELTDLRNSPVPADMQLFLPVFRSGSMKEQELDPQKSR